MKKSWLRWIRRKGKSAFDRIGSERLKTNLLLAIPFWIASLVVGIAAVVYTKMFGYAETLLQQALHGRTWIIFILTPVCFFIARELVTRFAPAARGSGIPQVMAAIDLAKPRQENRVSKLLGIRIMIIKVLSSFFMVLGGGAIGREGPTIQIAGSIFNYINKKIPRSWPKLSQKSFILTGAAAGLAAAFNAPLGGIAFAIEELARVHISTFRTALFTAVIIAGLAAKSVLGSYLYLGYPAVNDLDNWILAGVVLSAILSGLLGSLMGKLILALIRLKKNFSKPQNWQFILGTGLLIALFAFYIDPGVLGSGKELMNHALFSADKDVPFYLVLARFAGPILSFNVGAAGGIFAPSLATGAAVGGYLSGLLGLTGGNANILILSGMVGFLTGVTRTPFTSAILVLEMTDRHTIIVHLILAAMVSHIVALFVDKHSLYEHLKKDYLGEAVTKK
jgi:H+/Cl- antiporter ClcA